MTEQQRDVTDLGVTEQLDVEEQLDVVSATGQYLRTAGRREVHDGGHWHEVFHCMVVRSSLPATVILQRRHRSKAAFPGLLDLSATGHLAAGESPAEGVRELNEEMGTTATAEDLTYIGVRLLADDDGEGQNRERVNLFFMADDRPIEEFAPDPIEVESLVEVEVDGLLGLINGLKAGSIEEQPNLPAVEWQPGSNPIETKIGAADLIKPDDGYWTVVLVHGRQICPIRRPAGHLKINHLNPGSGTNQAERFSSCCRALFQQATNR